MPLGLLALAICAFAFGCTEFVVIGILPILAPEFQISLAVAGHLVTWYAIGIIFGAPLISAFTFSVPRKTLIAILLAVFTFGNFLAAIATSYSHLVIGRILTGLVHGAFFALGTSIAMNLCPKEKQGRAIAIMISGLTIALVAGVPLGTFLASSFSWRVTFYVVTVFGLIGFLSTLLLLPSHIHYDKPKHIFRQFNVLLQGKLLMAYLMTILGFGGPFIAYTYIAAILRNVSGFSQYWVVILLIVYGVAVAFGNIWGGKLSDRRGPLITLRDFMLALIVILVAFHFGEQQKIVSVFLLLAWGVGAFSIVPALQFYVMTLVKELKVEAADVASGLNIAAFNVGIAGGSFIGSLVVAHWGLAMTTLVSALVVFAAFILTFFVHRRTKFS